MRSTAKSPADYVWIGENMEGLLVSPPLFEKYFIPEYEKCCRIIHGHGKKVAFHMDGRLNVLKNLIAQTPIDIIEAFHPPPWETFRWMKPPRVEGQGDLGRFSRGDLFSGDPGGEGIYAEFAAGRSSRRTAGHRHVHRKPGIQ